MDIIAITRELGKQLQQEESYIKMRAAQQACDEAGNGQQGMEIGGMA